MVISNFLVEERKKTTSNLSKVGDHLVFVGGILKD